MAPDDEPQTCPRCRVPSRFFVYATRWRLCTVCGWRHWGKRRRDRAGVDDVHLAADDAARAKTA